MLTFLIAGILGNKATIFPSGFFFNSIFIILPEIGRSFKNEEQKILIIRSTNEGIRSKGKKFFRSEIT